MHPLKLVRSKTKNLWAKSKLYPSATYSPNLYHRVGKSDLLNVFSIIHKSITKRYTQIFNTPKYSLTIVGFSSYTLKKYFSYNMRATASKAHRSTLNYAVLYNISQLRLACMYIFISNLNNTLNNTRAKVNNSRKQRLDQEVLALANGQSTALSLDLCGQSC